MKQVMLQKGEVCVEDIPTPQVEPGTVLVRTHYSCISVGTELSGLKRSGQSLLQKAIQHPEKVKRTLKMVFEQGLAKTRAMVNDKLGGAKPTGYSAAGRVVAVGQGVSGFAVGDLVGCAGSQWAFHAEVICVPQNLVVPIPQGVNLRDASTVTLGAIALQGVRRLNPTLGETFVVLGLGVLGQLTVQILKANGCRVFGLDLDPVRCAQTKSLGAEDALASSEDLAQRLLNQTNGYGADGVVITAATSSNEVVSQAFGLCRKKGRVVLVGDVGLDLDRDDIYEKEIDFLISCSYGPGRYDTRYENDGLDYPMGYVRWTENRNMAAYLDLIKAGAVQLDPLIQGEYAVDDAPQAFARLSAPQDRPLALVLKFDDAMPMPSASVQTNHQISSASSLQIGLVGAGQFARQMHLPHLKDLTTPVTLRSVMSRSGVSAKTVAEQYSAAVATTDYQDLLRDPQLQAVMLCSPHDQHAHQVLAGLNAGKHVFVEKPLCLTVDELEQIKKYYAKNPSGPVLMTGYNRRFSPLVEALAQQTQKRTTPLMINYRMNAGFIPKNHWVQGPQGGGRNLGEACHIYDLFLFLTGAKFSQVKAIALRPTAEHLLKSDNFVVTISFEDGSVGNLIYTAQGDRNHPKEQMEVFWDGEVATLDDYKELRFAKNKNLSKTLRATDKGHRQELERFFQCLSQGGTWPISFEEQCQSMQIAFMVEQQIWE